MKDIQGNSQSYKGSDLGERTDVIPRVWAKDDPEKFILRTPYEWKCFCSDRGFRPKPGYQWSI